MQQFSYKLLPVNNINVVLNFAAPMNYHKGTERNAAPEYSFTGIRNHYQLVDQAGECNIFGVSFFPAGFYPFWKFPLSEYMDQTIDFSLCEKIFRSKIEESLNRKVPFHGRLKFLKIFFYN